MIRIAVPEPSLREACRRNLIHRLSFFGSVIREDFGPDSDVDVLVEFEPGARVGFFRLHDIEHELSEILGGRRVDLNTPAMLSERFRERVKADALVVYEAA